MTGPDLSDSNVQAAIVSLKTWRKPEHQDSRDLVSSLVSWETMSSRWCGLQIPYKLCPLSSRCCWETTMPFLPRWKHITAQDSKLWPLPIVSSVYCCISYSFTTCVLLKQSLNVCEWTHESINNPLSPRAVCVCVCMLNRYSYVWLCSPPGSSVHGILLAGTLEWVAMSSSRGSYISYPGRSVLYH